MTHHRTQCVATSPARSITGEVVAGYRVLRRLGAGGMGEVYLVQHPRLPRRDALKMSPPAALPDGTHRERLVREAELASRLWHPNIVTVYDRGDHDGRVWITMEYVDGIDAATGLSRHFPAGMPVADVLAIVTAVAAALDHAHGRGFIHRDVKPANIMVSDGDHNEKQRIMLADFGIAQSLDVAGEGTGGTAGTLPYAAPEQLAGRAVDGNADQYSLAATAYHLLTGEHLFPDLEPMAVIGRHLMADPPTLARTRPELIALDPVLARGLAKRPADRFARCADFASALASADAAGYPRAGGAALKITRRAMGDDGGDRNHWLVPRRATSGSSR
jgi:serine/threonine protein kinase, bacterial